MQKKKTKRSQAKNADLQPSLNLKTRYDLYDQDYLDKLSPKELEWLNQFNKEYVGDSLDREQPKNNLHNTRALIKDCGDRNNSRNRDVLTRAKAANHLADYEELVDKAETHTVEDDIIGELDKKSIREAIDWLSEKTNRDEEKLETKLIIELDSKAKSATRKE
jgi:hypothetical protein